MFTCTVWIIDVTRLHRYVIYIYKGPIMVNQDGAPLGRYLSQVKENHHNIYCIENSPEMYDYIKLKKHVEIICQFYI